MPSKPPPKISLIPNPRRILILGGSNAGKLTFLKTLTGSLPAIDDSGSHAGLSHTHSLDTTYYTAQIPIWIDEIPAEASARVEWTAGYLSAEARPVLEAVGAFVVTFRKPASEQSYEDTKAVLAEAGKVLKACGSIWDGVCLAIAMPQGLQPRLDVNVDAWEELCRSAGFEYVDFEQKGRDEYGDTAGMERVREALEANDWAGEVGEDAASFGDFEGGEGEDALKPIGDEMEREMFGLRSAISGENVDTDRDQELDVEELEATMAKLRALRDLDDGVPLEQRRKLAAKAISDLMKS